MGARHQVFKEFQGSQYFCKIPCRILFIIYFLKYLILADFWTDCPSCLGLSNLPQCKAERLFWPLPLSCHKSGFRCGRFWCVIHDATTCTRLLETEASCFLGNYMV